MTEASHLTLDNGAVVRNIIRPISDGWGGTSIPFLKKCNNYDLQTREI